MAVIINQIDNSDTDKEIFSKIEEQNRKQLTLKTALELQESNLCTIPLLQVQEALILFVERLVLMLGLESEEPARNFRMSFSL